ncbi:hypothetical protein ACOSQ3_017157 [Xanthoceras sorbifolium]
MDDRDPLEKLETEKGIMIIKKKKWGSNLISIDGSPRDIVTNWGRFISAAPKKRLESLLPHKQWDRGASPFHTNKGGSFPTVKIEGMVDISFSQIGGNEPARSLIERHHV